MRVPVIAAFLVSTLLAACAATPAPVRSVPDSSRMLHLELIGRMIEEGKPYAALAHLDAFEKAAGQHAQMHLLRGNALLDIGDAAAARTSFERLLGGPLAGFGHDGLGRVASAAGDVHAACAAFAAAVAEMPANPHFLSALGQSQIKCGTPEQGSFAIRKALELAPDDPEIRAMALGIARSQALSTDQAETQQAEGEPAL